MTLEDFEELKNKHGLVPMLITRSFAPYTANKIAGFQPEVALRIFKMKNGVPWSPEKGALASFDPDEGPKEPETETAVVPIPEDWREMHQLQRIALAKKLTGMETKFTVAAADEAIEAELQRRGLSNGTQPHEARNPGGAEGSSSAPQ